ncbi:LOW QUALITY PROTEIN: hypothetical protein NC653_011748 [Populus alba x Populus x berolinensis]|uniref:Uncharacterized protein n=1 Tax=Populus alba x Populus x berolinensis TaxID=444605 RepID=A0AAD6W6U5_9ROSI|nr:LOW QUALITY PROTEIN: hypothetical protein NC653_011748 [Populus alba x Populus x berolinensis]
MSIPKTIDSSLRSDSFTAILTDLENASLSSDLPPHLAKKLKENHAWFVETLSLYEKPNAGSRVALNLEKIKAVAAARVLSMLFITAYYIEPNSSGNVCFGLDDKQIADIRHSVKSTLVKQLDQNGDLFVATVNLLTAATHYQILNFLAAKAELILNLMRSMQSNLSLSICTLVLKMSGSGLKLLNGFRSSVTGVKTIKLMLMLLLLALDKSSEKESQDFAEVSNVCLGLLPILCNCITATECSSLSLATIDLKHLQLPHVILKLHDHSSFSSVPITLKFLLTLARVRGGVEMLLSAGFFSSLRALFAYSSGVVPSTIMTNDKVFIKHSDKTKKPQTIWGLGLAVVVAMIHSLGDSSYTEILDKELIASENLPEELEFCKKPSFLNSRNGLFSLPPLCCASKPMSSAFSVITTATVGKGHSVSAYLVALHIYRISFLLLKYLCMETEGAAKRSEEVGFADLTQIPELPMLEILHGLQDQAVAIVPELCGSNKSRYINSEIQSVCLLLLPIMEIALYLEFCVLQICGRSPVLGRVEEFSKEVKLLSKAMGVYVFLKASVTSLKHLTSLLYPVLSKTEGGNAIHTGTGLE